MQGERVGKERETVKKMSGYDVMSEICVKYHYWITRIVTQGQEFKILQHCLNTQLKLSCHTIGFR